MLGRVFVSSALIAALALEAGAARADDPSQKLFDEGNALAAKGNYEEACPKLAESLRLEPAVGTQFNLADCYEHLGRVATAHALYIDVIRIAHSAGKFQREEAAKQRAALVEPKVPHLRLKSSAVAPGYTLKLDGKELTRDQWSDLPLDPGPHTVVASAPGRTDETRTITLEAGKSLELEMPDVVDPNPPAPPPQVEPPEAAPAPRSTARKIGTPLVEGITLAGLITGSIAGGLALSKKGDAEDLCPEATYHFRCPTKAGADAWSSASSTGNVSTIAFAIGGVALATTIVLWVTAPPRHGARALSATPGIAF